MLHHIGPVRMEWGGLNSIDYWQVRPGWGLEDSLPLPPLLYWSFACLCKESKQDNI